MSSFSFEVGITACSCIALLALRMRVSMSAIGSVSIGSPGGLGHAGDRALVGELPQADAAEAELAERRPRPAAPVAAQVVARLVLRRPRGLHYERLLRHYCPPSRVWANGRPMPRRSARASSSVLAVVVIVTSRPRIAATLS